MHSKADRDEIAGPVSGSEAEPPPKRFTWSSFIKLIFSLSLIGIVLYFSDLQEFIDAAEGLSSIYLFAFAILVYLDRALVVYKWNLLLVVRGVRVSFLHLFRLYSTALLAGVVLPSTVGGDMFRVYDLKKLNVSAKVTIASIVVERVLGFICMLVIAALGLGIGVYLMTDSSLRFVGIAWVLVFGLLMCAGFLVVVRSEFFNNLVDRIAEKYGERWGIGMLNEVYQRCREYRNDVAVLLKVTAYTLLRQTVPILMNILLVYAYGIEASFLELFAIIPLIVLGTRLPISLDGLGVQEGLYVVLFGLVGVSVSQALLLSLTFRVMSMLCTLPFGVMYLMSNRPEKSSVPSGS
jgi:uncharacterized protein (TIRG00374 family)